MRAAVAVVLVLAITSCSKEDTAGKSPPPKAKEPSPTEPGVDVEGFCKKTMAGRNPKQCYGRDKSAERIKLSFCTEILRSALRAKRISIDPGALAECETAVVGAIETLDNQRGLSDLAQRFEPCRRVTIGRQAAGAECNSTMECAPNLVCKESKCQPWGRAGEDCLPVIEISFVAPVDSTCGVGLHCELGDRKCVAQGGAGDACFGRHSCQMGLACRDRKCVTRVPSASGGQCDEHPDCPEGEICDLMGDRCIPRKADGEECLLDTECKNECLDSGVCGPCGT